MVPVPLRLTVCVLPATPLLLSVIVSVPRSAPVAVGVKVTLIVHDPLTARLVPQLFVWLKFALVAMLLILSADGPEFVKLTDFALLGAPTF